MAAMATRDLARVAAWSESALAAIDALRGVRPGAIITDEFPTTSQVSVITDRGPVVLLSRVAAEKAPVPTRIVVGVVGARIGRLLRLPPIAVRWFGPPVWGPNAEVFVHDVEASHVTFDEQAPEGHQRLLSGITGPATPCTIWLHASLRGDDLLRTVAHEMRHAQQLWGDLDVRHEDRERDATAFAEWWMGQPR